jgi:hypothetical protein
VLPRRQKLVSHAGGGVDHVLTVVEDDEDMRPISGRGRSDRFPGPDHDPETPGDRVHNGIGRLDVRQLAHDDISGDGCGRVDDGLQRQAGLADAARTDHGHEAVLGQEQSQVLELPLATDEP